MKKFNADASKAYEMDKENSTITPSAFNPKWFNYKDVAEKLFIDNAVFYFDDSGEIFESTLAFNECAAEPNNATSEKQLKKLLAMNMLMNVAKYLNGDWKPDWTIHDNKYYIAIDYTEGTISTYDAGYFCSDIAFFKSRELAEQAINILGEDTIRLALSTDW